MTNSVGMVSRICGTGQVSSGLWIVSWVVELWICPMGRESISSKSSVVGFHVRSTTPNRCSESISSSQPADMTPTYSIWTHAARRSDPLHLGLSVKNQSSHAVDLADWTLDLRLDSLVKEG